MDILDSFLEGDAVESLLLYFAQQLLRIGFFQFFFSDKQKGFVLFCFVGFYLCITDAL